MTSNPSVKNLLVRHYVTWPQKSTRTRKSTLVSYFGLLTLSSLSNFHLAFFRPTLLSFVFQSCIFNAPRLLTWYILRKFSILMTHVDTLLRK